MTRIANVILFLMMAMPLAACSLSETRAMVNKSKFPQGQCELRAVAGSEVTRLASTCTAAGTGIESSRALLRFASNTRIFFQRELKKHDLVHGVNILEEVLNVSATGRQLAQVGGGYLPTAADNFWKTPAYVFVAVDARQLKVTFNTGSDAVVVYQQSDGSLAADYVVY